MSTGGGGIRFTSSIQRDLLLYYVTPPGSLPAEPQGRTTSTAATSSATSAAPQRLGLAPHLHFAIFRLTPEHQWWKGEPINPNRS